jgi:hypothetical protein
MTILACPQNGCFTILVLMIHIHLVAAIMSQQSDNNVGTARSAGPQQRGVTIFVLKIQIQIVVFQQLNNHVNISMGACHYKGSVTTVIALMVDIYHAVFVQQFKDFVISVFNDPFEQDSIISLRSGLDRRNFLFRVIILIILMSVTGDGAGATA